MLTTGKNIFIGADWAGFKTAFPERTAPFSHCIDMAGLTATNTFHKKTQVFCLSAGVNNEV